MVASKRILIVDDSRGLTSSLTLILRKKGFETETARTGREALIAVRKRMFDLVLLDSNLPDIDSVALLPTFFDILPGTPVILMTTGSSKESMASAANKGYLPFLTKPLDMDVVLAKVREALGDGKEFSERRHSMRVIEEIQERFRTMIEASNDLFFQCNVDGIVTYCSPSSRRLLGYSPEEVIGTHFREYFPASELPATREAFETTRSGGTIELLELLVLKKDRTLLPTEVNAVPILRNGKIVGSQGIIRDISDRRRSEESILLRDRILEAIGFAAEKFLTTTSWRDDIGEILRRLGEAAEVSRIYIFENHLSDRGQLLCSQRHEWAATGIEPQIDNPDLQGFPLKKAGFKRWIDVMERGDIIWGRVSEFPKSEREILSGQGIVSIAAVPIFVGGSWWGIIGFDECTRVRDWSKPVLGALRTAATTIGAAIQREKTGKMMKEQTFLIEEIFHNVQDGIGIVDENENIVYCNPSYARILDEKIEHVIGRNLSEFMDKSSYSIILDQTKGRIRGESSTYDLPLTTNNGIQKHIRISASPRFAEDGRYIGAFGSIRDITDLKQAGDALQRSEKRYRELVDNALVGIFQSNVNGDIFFLNNRLVDMLEYESAEEMSSGGAFKFYKDPGDRAAFVKMLKKKKRVDLLLLELRTKKGKTVYADMSAVLHGDIIFGTVVDVTDRERARAALQEARAQLQHVVDSSPSVIYSCAIESRGKSKTRYIPTFVSENIREIFGHKVEECLGDGTWWARHIHPGDKERAIGEMNRLFTEGKLAHEYRIRRKDGNYRWVRDQLILLKDSKGAAREFVGSWSDVTDRKETEKAILRRDAILHAVSQAAEEFLRSTDWQDSIRDELESLGRAADVCRIYLFQNHRGKKGEILTSQRYEWAREGVTPQIDNPSLQNFDFRAAGWGRWMKTLGEGKAIYGHVRDFPRAEKKELIAEEVKSICVMPVFVEGTWWGSLGISVCRFEREWTMVELDALRTAANILGQAIRRCRSESELRESKEFVDEIFNSVSDAISVIDVADYRILGVNRAFLDTWGVKREEVVGRPCHLVTHGRKTPCDPEKDACPIDTAISSGKPSKSLHVHQANNGDEKYLEVTAVPLRNDSGEIDRVIHTAHDVTAARKAEETLMASERKYRDLVDTALVGIIQSTVDGEILFVNDALVKTTGFKSSEELIAQGAMPRYRDLDQRKEWLRRLKKEGRVDNYEVEIVKKDGSSLYMLISSTMNHGVLTTVVLDITDRKRIEEELRESEQRFRSVFDNASVGICAADTKSHRIHITNERFNRMMGYRPDEMVKLFVPDLHPAEELDWVMAEFVNISSGLITGCENIPMKRKDGSVFYADIAGSYMRLERKKLLVGFFQDVTERKKAEEALKASEVKYRDLVDTALVGIIQSTVNGEILFVNEALVKIVGFESAEEMIADGALMRYRDLDQRKEWLRRLRKEGRIDNYEVRIARKDGSSVDMLISSTLNDGVLTTVVLDISDRKRVEEELQRAEEKYRTIFESTGTATIICDEDMTVLMVNEKLEQLFGLKRKEMVGKMKWTELIHEDDLPRMLTYHRQRSKDPSKAPQAYECRAIAKRGDILHLYLTVTLIPGTTHRMASLIDITDRKEMEQELLRSHEELRNLSSHLHLVREEERGRISREIHDELGQSLSVLKMHLAWLGGKIPKEETKLKGKIGELEKLVQGCVQQVQRIATELRPRLLDDLGLLAALEWHMENFREQTGIRCRFTSKPVESKFDKHLSTTIYRIFQEALTNVYRHANASAVTVKLENESGKVVLTVKDNGVGIGEEKVKDPHSLGLIGMKERAQTWGGKVVIRGTKSKGTTLTLTIPLSRKGKSL